MFQQFFCLRLWVSLTSLDPSPVLTVVEGAVQMEAIVVLVKVRSLALSFWFESYPPGPLCRMLLFWKVLLWYWVLSSRGHWMRGEFMLLIASDLLQWYVAPIPPS